MAELVFLDTRTGAELLQPLRGCWVGQHYNYATFASGQTHDLIVVFEQHGMLEAVDDGRARDSSYGRITLTNLPGDRLTVRIRLIGETVTWGPFVHTFAWSAQHGLRITSAARSDIVSPASSSVD